MGIPQRKVYVQADGTPRLMFSRYADTDGDGSGTKNANGDYSGGEEIFYIQPPADESFYVSRLIVSIEDASGFSAAEYGNLAAALSTGVEVRVQDDAGTIIDLTDALPVKTNAGWGALCYDVDLKTWGQGNELLVVRWTFSKSGQFIKLNGDDGERLEIVLNDDLDGLVGHRFLLQGYRVDNTPG